MEKQFLHAQMEKMHEGIELYSEIMNLFDQSDLNNPDDACRKAIDKFYIVRRMKKERKLYFYGFFEENKHNKDLNFETCLRYILEKTNRIETSFCSKMLHTINPMMPIFDKNVRLNLGIRSVPSIKDKESQCNIAVCIYKQLADKYHDYFQTQGYLEAIRLFDSYYPEYSDKISPVKKTDFFLWKFNKSELKELGMFSGFIGE